MVQDASGKLVTAAEALKMGDSVSITFKQGSADATVIRVQSD
jgi:exonuclease VII large subunit